MRSLLFATISLLIISCQAQSTKSTLVGKIPFQLEDDMIFINGKSAEEMETKSWTAIAD